MRFPPGGERLDDGQLGFGDVAVATCEPGAFSRRLAAPDFAGEQAIRQREIGQHAKAEMPCRGNYLGFSVALEQRPVVLCRYKRDHAVAVCRASGLGYLPAAEVG